MVRRKRRKLTKSRRLNSCFGKVKFPRGVIGEDGKQFVKGVSGCSLVSFCYLRCADLSGIAYSFSTETQNTD